MRHENGVTDGKLSSRLAKLAGADHAKAGRVVVGLSFDVHLKMAEHGSEAMRAYGVEQRRLLPAEFDAAGA